MLYPHKSTPLYVPIDPLLEKRWSPTAFSAEPIEPEKIASLFEAMRWAPSCFNEQPWRVVYATQQNQASFQQLSSLLNEGNNWAKNAYMLALVGVYPTFARNGKVNAYAEYDTGAGAENFFLQAVSMDLVAHEMAGFDAEKANVLFQNRFPDAHVLSMIVVGYPGNREDLPPDLQQREGAERTRKPVAEVAVEL